MKQVRRFLALIWIGPLAWLLPDDDIETSRAFAVLCTALGRSMLAKREGKADG